MVILTILLVFKIYARNHIVLIVLSNKFIIFFNFPLWHYCNNFRQWIICCLFSGDIYLSFDISMVLFSICKEGCESFCGEIFVILLAILLPIKLSVDSAAFWITLVDALYIASAADILVWSRSFWFYLSLKSLPILLPVFLAEDKQWYPFTNILSLVSVE